MRVLIVTNMWPTPAAPAFGSFVRDQVDALRALGAPDLDLEVFAFGPGGYAGAARELRRRHGRERFDVVHAHFGLSAWPALAARARARVLQLHGTDVRHPRSRRITQAALPFQDLVAVPSDDLRAALPRGARRVAVLPAGVDTGRFRPADRAAARAALGLDPQARYLLFPADPARPGKRHDRALAVARAARAELLTAGAIDPAQMPQWVNAANAVVVPSDHEGFGLAVLEALACDVAVAATPTGIHPRALEGVAGTLCAPFDAGAWAAALEPALADPDARIAGRASAERWSAAAMAAQLLAAWRALPVEKGAR
jgi:glycosyltransferase involved in cell wall biosynthesis